MSTFLIKEFWCCLHPNERDVLTGLFNNYTTGVPFVLKQTYDVLWAVTGAKSLLDRKAALIVVYGLRLETIEVPNIGNVEAYFFEGEFWEDLVIFAEENPLTCAEKCSYLTYSDEN